MVFRCDAKNFFLTYPQSANITTKEDLLEFLKNRRPGVTYCIVSKESHADGNTHYHALLCLTSRYDCRNESYFDFQGHHPNVQSARNTIATIKYIKKDGDFIESGGFALGQHHKRCESLNRGEWEEYCIENKIPFAFCESIWKRCNPITSNTIFTSPQEGTLCRALQQFEFNDWRSPLVLVGPTGCGKTVWALRNSPKPALFISHIDRLREFNDHKCIIFDDMVFKHIPVQAQIHLVDNYMPRDIHIRYCVAHIPAGVAKIFTCNERPFDDHPAINRRIRYFSINTDFS